MKWRQGKSRLAGGLSRILLDSLARLLPVGHCSLCRQTLTRGEILLCSTCHGDLPRPPALCPRCGLAMHDSSGTECGRCQREPPPWERMVVLDDYRSPYRELLLDLKYRGQRLNGELLGHLLAERIARNAEPLPQWLLPVPLHPWRAFRRGYNQAELIGLSLSRQLRLPLATHACRRLRPTRSQAGLSRAQRKRNLKGAFLVELPETVEHIALIDDVVTTGSTVSEIIRQLPDPRPRVEIWAACRTQE